MKMYHCKETTPLRYHSIFRYIAVPISMITNISVLTHLLHTPIALPWLNMVYVSVHTVFFILLAICFTGFFRWRAYAWYSLMIYLSLYTAFAFWNYLITIIALSVPFSKALLDLLAALVFSITLSVYYAKRRPLFLPYRKVSTDTFRFCPQCSQKLAPNVRFCGKCGHPVSDNETRT